MIRDTIEQEDLVEAETQEILQQRVLRAGVGFTGDEPIEQSLPTYDAVNELLAKAPVRRGKSISLQFGFEPIFDKNRLTLALQKEESNFSWILAVHNL